MKKTRVKKLSSLSVFFPSYNDSRILPWLMKKTYEVLPKVTLDFEVIVVNDGSTDNTQHVLTSLTRRYPRLKIVRHEKNLGYGAALISGFKYAKNEWVFYTDSDGQYNPKEIAHLVHALEKNIDVVNGYKLQREDTMVRRIVGFLYNFLLQKLYHLPISDVDCDFRLIKRSFLKKIDLLSSSGTICLELVIKLKKAGASFKEIGIHHYKRPYGSSRFFTPKNVAKTLYDNLVFYLQYTFS